MSLLLNDGLGSVLLQDGDGLLETQAGAAPITKLSFLDFSRTFSHAKASPAGVVSDFGFNVISAELRLKHAELVTRGTILVNSTIEKSIWVERVADTLKIYLSSDGISWDIANGVVIYSGLTISEYYLTIEHSNGAIVFFFNGMEVFTILTNLYIYDPTDKSWHVGSFSGGWESSLEVFSWRINIGNIRYGGDHSAIAIPYADSDSYSAGNLFSNNFALMMGDIASNKLYGLGAQLDGLVESKDWCDIPLEDNPLIPHGHGGVVFNRQTRTESVLNVMSEYAACIWQPYKEKVLLSPDKELSADLPFGKDVLTNGDFNSNTGWTEGGSWTISSGVATVNNVSGFDEILSSTIVTENSVDYSCMIVIQSVSGAGIKILIGGVEIMPLEIASGEFRLPYEAIGASSTIEIIAPDGVSAVISSMAVRRLAWLQERWIGSLDIGGPSDRGLPNSIVVSHKESTTSSANWKESETEIGHPLALSGQIPLIKSNLNMYGMPTILQAQNRGIRKISRGIDRVDIKFDVYSEGIMFRVGTIIQLKDDVRGVNILLWVSEITMVDYGVYRVKGIRYDKSHFTLSTTLSYDLILNEDAFPLILEDGGFAFLESSNF